MQLFSSAKDMQSWTKKQRWKMNRPDYAWDYESGRDDDNSFDILQPFDSKLLHFIFPSLLLHLF